MIYNSHDPQNSRSSKRKNSNNLYAKTYSIVSMFYFVGHQSILTCEYAYRIAVKKQKPLRAFVFYYRIMLKSLYIESYKFALGNFTKELTSPYKSVFLYCNLKCFLALSCRHNPTILYTFRKICLLEFELAKQCLHQLSEPE